MTGVTIATRQSQLTELTHAQVDANFINLKSAIDGSVDASNANAAAIAAFGQPGGSALIGNGLRSVASKLADIVNAKDFGVKGDGTLEDLATLQAAVAAASVGGLARTLLFPAGSYLIPDIFRIPASAKGIVIIGDSSRGTYFKTPSGSTFDMIHVAAAYTRISGIMFRPGGVQACVRLFAPNCEVSRNQALASTNDQGSFILFGDTDPAEVIPSGGSATVLSGCYTHTVDMNVVGAPGFAFAHVTEDVSLQGIQSCKITNNTAISNSPFKISKGGANFYGGNQIQPSTVGTGNGIDCGANVVSEKIGYNYIEGFANGILLRQTDETYPAAFISALVHFDNCTSKVTTLGTANFFFEDAGGRIITRNGWTDNCSSKTTRTFNGLSGGTAILTLDETNKAVKINKSYTTLSNLSFSADGQTQTPTQEVMVITGAGAPRANCVLGTAGVQDGQFLELMGVTWPVTLLNTNVRFSNNAASVNLGNTTGYIQNMTFRFRAADGKWWERTRSTY